MKLDPEALQKLAQKLRYTARINSQRFDDKHPLVGELREAADALSCLAGEGWRPIETAPKDGTLIWMGSAHGSMRIGFWQEGADHENNGSKGGGWRDFYRMESDGLSDALYEVTCWHPVPPAPSVEEKLP